MLYALWDVFPCFTTKLDVESIKNEVWGLLGCRHLHFRFWSLLAFVRLGSPSLARPWLARLLTGSLARSLTVSLARPLALSLTRSLPCSLARALAPSLARPLASSELAPRSLALSLAPPLAQRPPDPAAALRGGSSPRCREV